MNQDPNDPSREEQLEITVGMIWREHRVSCPHADILRSFVDGALDAGAAGYVAFHVTECQCPYCGAVIDELRANGQGDTGRGLDGLRERVLRSTSIYLRPKGHPED
jgi:hypothetical protein